MVSKLKNKTTVIYFAGILTEIFYLLFVFLNSNRNVPLYMFIYFEAFVVFLITLYIIQKKYLEINKPKTGEKFLNVLSVFARFISYSDEDLSKLKIPFFILLFGILFRLTLFPTTPTTSPDVYRYVWEGKVLYNGYNPFDYAPNSPELNSIHSQQLPAKVEYKDMAAIYPPLSQLSFAVSYAIFGENLTGLKIIYLLCEILTMIYLLKLLNLKKKNLNLILLYAWLPLPIMEYFINIHLEPFAIVFMIIFIYYIEKGYHLISAIPFAFAFLAKFYPIILFPLLIKKIGIKKTFLFAVIFSFLTLLFYLPFVSDKLGIFKSLGRYLGNWDYNSSIFKLLQLLTTDGDTIRLICSIGLMLSIGIIANMYKDFTKAAFGIFIAFIIFSTTVHPWYLGWLAAINPLTNFISVLSLFFTVGLTNFSYIGKWNDYTFVVLIEYFFFFLFLIFDLRNLRKKNVLKEDFN